MVDRAGPVKLGVNIDHAATLRNARGGNHPDILRAARAAMNGGADYITIHLREDRRHIQDRDLRLLRAALPAPINLELAATQEMLEIAVEAAPDYCCIVPERRDEVTTEGGLDAAGANADLAGLTSSLQAMGARVSFFIDADERQVRASRQAGADAVELHTGPLSMAMASQDGVEQQFERLAAAARAAVALGLEAHAGHGLDYGSAARTAQIQEITELNIGHFLIGEALFCGLDEAVRRMRHAIAQASAAGGRA